MSQEMIDSLLKELKLGLTTLYGNQLNAVYLFGSYARGEQDLESDFDVLIVLSYMKLYSAEIERTGELVSTLSLKYGVSISRKFMTIGQWTRTDSAIHRNILAEAVKV